MYRRFHQRLRVRSYRPILEILEDRTLLSFLPPIDYAVGSSPYYVDVGDLTGDNRLDLVTANPGSASLSVLLGNGDGSFQDPVNYAVGAGNYSLAVGNFTGAGPDLVTTNFGLNGEGRTVSVLLGNGDGTF
jgi:hypothetical protein